MKKTIMVMIDGFGIPENGWADSIYSECCGKDFVELFDSYSIPVDATMGVSGIPQSATGQTALFTGCNAAKLMNRHIQGFPGPSLRKVIQEKNLFSELTACGLKVVFSNAYVQYTLDQLLKKGLASVTTVMTRESIGVVKTLADLKAGDAVYHDITRKSISERFAVDTITPEQGARDLMSIAGRHDFTLFEYFLTDHAGHKGDLELLTAALSDFSEFFCSLIGFAKNEIAVILTSDHGNCEQLDSKCHTLNPVPLFVYGLPMPLPEQVNSIENIFSYIYESFIGKTTPVFKSC
jgi:2,3-bisphosphoglycerate-independent phosphoglycerate mutase